MPLTNAKIAELRAAAEKATPGPWRVFEVRHNRFANQVHVGPSNHSVAHIPTWGTDEPRASNSRYIANCDPQTILSLLDEIEALRAALKPFAEVADRIEREHPGWDHSLFTYTNIFGEMETLDLFHAARRTLSSPEGTK